MSLEDLLYPGNPAKRERANKLLVKHKCYSFQPRVFIVCAGLVFYDSSAQYEILILCPGNRPSPSVLCPVIQVKSYIFLGYFWAYLLINCEKYVKIIYGRLFLH